MMYADTDDDSLIEIPLYGGFATTGGVFGMDIEVIELSHRFITTNNSTIVGRIHSDA